MFVGGEFYYDGRWMTAQPDLDTSGMYFLNGGQACLRVIGESLREMGFQRVLLPAYLCPSIIRALEPAGLQFAFYEVGWDLSININQAARMVTEGDAFYFINYFGFSPALSVQFFIRNLQQHGILVIEDNAQAGFPPESIGDFVFNSLRKQVPYDGGYLKSRFDLQPIISRYSGKPNRRLPLIRAYRQRLAGYLLSGGDDREELQALYEQAEKLYGTDGVVCGDLSERECIEHLDWKGIRQIRRENFLYLLEQAGSVPGVTPIFTRLPEGVSPYGLPVYLDPSIRDRVLDSLGDAEISLLVHWDEIAAHPLTRTNRQAVEMAGSMLTLPVDQRINRKQLDYLAVKLAGAVAACQQFTG
ncbi:MAG: hypothetical protein KBG60_09695 [Anaerolineaceae bacterium]|nr:hypothetical protein [Anaerolineaceae bacterium]